MRFEPSRPMSEEERVLPLINVVFLLLIFFMLAGQLGAVDPFRTEPPRSASEGLTQAHEMVVHISADERLAFGGTIVNEAELRGAIARHGAAQTVHLKADGRAAAVRVIAVMELLRAAGVERIDLLTLPEGR